MIKENFRKLNRRFQVVSPNKVVGCYDRDPVSPEAIGVGEPNQWLAAAIPEVRPHDLMARAVDEIPIIHSISVRNVELYSVFRFCSDFDFSNCPTRISKPVNRHS